MDTKSESHYVYTSWNHKYILRCYTKKITTRKNQKNIITNHKYGLITGVQCKRLQGSSSDHHMNFNYQRAFIKK